MFCISPLLRPRLWRRRKVRKRVFRGTPPNLSSIGFLVRPLRGRGEEGNQGTPLKPRQGLRPWTPLSKNLYLKAPPNPRQGGWRPPCTLGFFAAACGGAHPSGGRPASPPP